MLPIFLRAIFASCAAVPLVMCAAAFAADAPPAAANSTVKLAPVTVTARLRDEAAQSVPVSMSTVDGEQMQAVHIDQAQDLQQLLPGLNVAYIHARQMGIAVRGIGNNPANEGLDSSVATYLDGVYLGRPGMLEFNLLDIDQVELLRGPQGTLYGRNATAGALILHTRQPEFFPGAQFTLDGGNRGYGRMSAIATGPLSKHLAGRLLLAGSSDDGWIHNLYNGQTLDGIQRRGVRGQLLFEPSSDVSVRFIGDYFRDHGSQGTAVITGVGPAKPGFRNAQQTAAQLGIGPILTDWRDYDVSLDSPQSMRTRTGGLSAELNAQLGTHRLTSITAWRFWDFAPVNDIDLTPVKAVDDYGFSVWDNQFSQQIYLSSPVGDRFDYVIGVDLFVQQIRNRLDIDFGSDADAALLPKPYNDAGGHILDNTSTAQPGRSVTTSPALFAQGNVRLTDTLKLTAGVRGTYTSKSARVSADGPHGGASLGDPTQQAIRNGQLPAWDSGSMRREDFSPSGLLTLSYAPTADFMGYTTLSYGAKAGGFAISGTGSGPTSGAGSLRVAPETARNAEIGVKSQLWHGRVQINADVFVTEVRDYQAAGVRTPPGKNVPVVELSNAGAFRSQGVEWNLRTLPLRGLTLEINGAFDDARYTRFDNAPCPAETNPSPPVSCSLTGQQVQNAPRWIVNAIGSYRWWWRADLSQDFAMNYAWRSGSPGNIDNSIYNELPAYGLLNVSSALQLHRGPNTVDFALWVRNAANEKYLMTGGLTAANVYFASAGMPRTYGATLGYRFE